MVVVIITMATAIMLVPGSEENSWFVFILDKLLFGVFRLDHCCNRREYLEPSQSHMDNPRQRVRPQERPTLPQQVRSAAEIRSKDLNTPGIQEETKCS